MISTQVDSKLYKDDKYVGVFIVCHYLNLYQITFHLLFCGLISICRLRDGFLQRVFSAWSFEFNPISCFVTSLL